MNVDKAHVATSTTTSVAAGTRDVIERKPCTCGNPFRASCFCDQEAVHEGLVVINELLSQLDEKQARSGALLRPVPRSMYTLWARARSIGMEAAITERTMKLREILRDDSLVSPEEVAAAVRELHDATEGGWAEGSVDDPIRLASMPGSANAMWTLAYKLLVARARALYPDSDSTIGGWCTLREAFARSGLSVRQVSIEMVKKLDLPENGGPIESGSLYAIITAGDSEYVPWKDNTLTGAQHAALTKWMDGLGGPDPLRLRLLREILGELVDPEILQPRKVLFMPERKRGRPKNLVVWFDEEVGQIMARVETDGIKDSVGVFAQNDGIVRDSSGRVVW